MTEDKICFQGKHGGEPMVSIFVIFLCDKVSDKKQLKGREVHLREERFILAHGVRSP